MVEAVENNMITAILDGLIVIPRVDGTSNETVVLRNQLLRPSILLVRANDG